MKAAWQTENMGEGHFEPPGFVTLRDVGVFVKEFKVNIIERPTSSVTQRNLVGALHWMPTNEPTLLALCRLAIPNCTNYTV